jgi:hypothetical protein
LALQLDRLAGFDRQRVALEIGLIARLIAGNVGITGFERRRLRRNDGRGPIFVGDAEPAAGRLGNRYRCFFDVLVFFFRQAAVFARNAEKAFMDDEDRGNCGLVVARHTAIGGKGDRRLSGVLHLVGDRDHVMLVD